MRKLTVFIAAFAVLFMAAGCDTGTTPPAIPSGITVTADGSTPVTENAVGILVGTEKQFTVTATGAESYPWQITGGSAGTNFVGFRDVQGVLATGDSVIIEGKVIGGPVTIRVTAVNTVGPATYDFQVTVTGITVKTGGTDVVKDETVLA